MATSHQLLNRRMAVRCSRTLKSSVAIQKRRPSRRIENADIHTPRDSSVVFYAALLDSASNSKDVLPLSGRERRSRNGTGTCFPVAVWARAQVGDRVWFVACCGVLDCACSQDRVEFVVAASGASRASEVMADPGIPINCPTCGAPLVYVRTEGETHVYRCPPQAKGRLDRLLSQRHRIPPI
jgi:hypothetical protein